MRALLAAAVALAPSAARAQEAPVPAAPPVVVEVAAAEGEREPLLGLDLLLGQQTGIRPSLSVFRSERSAVIVEGFYGATFSRFGASEAVGVGARYVTVRGGRDAVTVGPGADVFFNFRDGAATFLAPTVDVAWRRDFGERVGCTFGINAGIGIGLGGDRGNAAGRVGPLISLYGGLRF